jgi:GntR family transcriptional regulator, transcriptional repressor for pyruvate dehydrogenase complex
MITDKKIGSTSRPPHKNGVEKLDGLEPLINMNMTDQVEERLRKYFSQNGYKIGDPIPKEQELAKALNVSRSIVREAISRLRMMGMIESRKRRGMILTEPDIMNSLERFADSKMLLSKDCLNYV